MWKLPPYASLGEKILHKLYLLICALIFLFLILPIIIIIPLSFNVEPYFSFTEGMLKLDPQAYSMRWYKDIFFNGMTNPQEANFSTWWQDTWNNGQWVRATRNSFFIAIMATLVATFFGTLAALGLSRPEMPFRSAITSLLISPMIVPLVITATGMYFFYSNPMATFGLSDSGFKLSQSHIGVILAHATLGIPFVIITVTATLVGFDRSLIRAANNMGANGFTTFRRVIMPLITPGMISGALFAFITSLDEVVVVLFIGGPEQRTIPRQMWSGIREQISPTILAVATVLVFLSICLLTVTELLRRRSERLRGLSPG